MDTIWWINHQETQHVTNLNVVEMSGRKYVKGKHFRYTAALNKYQPMLNIYSRNIIQITTLAMLYVHIDVSNVISLDLKTFFPQVIPSSTKYCCYQRELLSYTSCMATIDRSMSTFPIGRTKNLKKRQDMQ